MSKTPISSARTRLRRSRRNQAQALAALAAVLVTCLAAVGMTTPAAAQENKPNILFIMGDDIGWMQVGLYHEGIGIGKTPVAEDWTHTFLGKSWLGADWVEYA
jgi:predicted NAD/FAD-dependent oxidoreductase